MPKRINVQKMVSGKAYFNYLTPLELPVPPGFDVALGYHDEAEALSFFWEFGGLYCDDGVNGYTADTDVWETWTAVPQVQRALEPFNLIRPVTDSDWCLVLVTEQQFFAAEIYDLFREHLHGPQKILKESCAPARTRQLQQAAKTNVFNWLREHHGSSPSPNTVGEASRQ